MAVADSDIQDLHIRFDYHQPDAQRKVKHETCRRELHLLAVLLYHQVPNCRERSLALTKLEEAMFWWNAAIAREPAYAAREG